MTKEIWLNLPVKNVAASKAFFEKIGFSFNEQQTTEHSACMVVGSKKTVVMLFAEPIFVGFTGGAALSDASKSAEILISRIGFYKSIPNPCQHEIERLPFYF